MSSYTMYEYVSNWQSFQMQFNNEIETAYNDLRNTLANAENMSNDEIAAALNLYAQAEYQALTNAADAVATSSSVSSDPAASSVWQDIKNGIDAWWDRKWGCLPTGVQEMKLIKVVLVKQLKS